MIDAIQTSHTGYAFATRDPGARRERRHGQRRAPEAPPAERVEIEDALEAVDLEASAPEAVVADGATVTAAAVARRLARSADRALAMQARLGSTAVLRLVGADG